MKYNPNVVAAWFRACKIPKPEFEFKFHPDRRWRFDIAWPVLCSPSLDSNLGSLALEVQGGIWTGGRHTRGAALMKEWEKLNTAAMLGWRIIYCQPCDLMTEQTVRFIKQALAA